MNRERRKRLMFAVDLMSKAKDVVDNTLNDEQEAIDRIPENLDSSEAYSKMEDAIDLMENASDNLGDAIDWILEATK